MVIFSDFVEDSQDSRIGSENIVIQDITEFVKPGFEIFGIANPYSKEVFAQSDGPF